jgi:hypothetical protein
VQSVTDVIIKPHPKSMSEAPLINSVPGTSLRLFSLQQTTVTRAAGCASDSETIHDDPACIN